MPFIIGQGHVIRSYWREQYNPKGFHPEIFGEPRDVFKYLGTPTGWCWGVGTPVWSPESDLGCFVLFAGKVVL